MNHTYGVGGSQGRLRLAPAWTSSCDNSALSNEAINLKVDPNRVTFTCCAQIFWPSESDRPPGAAFPFDRALRGAVHRTAPWPWNLSRAAIGRDILSSAGSFGLDSHSSVLSSNRNVSLFLIAFWIRGASDSWIGSHLDQSMSCNAWPAEHYVAGQEKLMLPRMRINGSNGDTFEPLWSPVV